MNVKNSKKTAFIQSFPAAEFNNATCDHAGRCKFNLSYFDPSQPAGQNFDQWSHEQLSKLLNKLKDYGKHPLKYWLGQRCGGGGLHVLEIYPRFPANSDFLHPKHIPKNVRWCRFRLEGDMRLIGFVIPNELNMTKSQNQDYLFDANTFYIVFLDENHKFYKS